jgi:hypothetical protein
MTVSSTRAGRVQRMTAAWLTVCNRAGCRFMAGLRQIRGVAGGKTRRQVCISSPDSDICRGKLHAEMWAQGANV